MEEHHARRVAGGDRGEPDADRRHRENGEHWNPAGLRDCLHRDFGSAAYEPWPASPLPHALGAVRARHGYHFQRLHDVQTRLDQLGAIDYLVDYRVGGVFHLQPETQPNAGGIGRPQGRVTNFPVETRLAASPVVRYLFRLLPNPELRGASASAGLCSAWTAEGGCPYANLALRKLVSRPRSGGRRRSSDDYFSCSFFAIAATIRRGAKRTDCATSQFLNPEIATGLPAINAR